MSLQRGRRRSTPGGRAAPWLVQAAKPGSAHAADPAPAAVRPVLCVVTCVRHYLVLPTGMPCAPSLPWGRQAGRQAGGRRTCAPTAAAPIQPNTHPLTALPHMFSALTPLPPPPVLLFNTHRISCGFIRLALEVPTVVPYCAATAAAFLFSSSWLSRPCITVVAPPAASCLRMPAPMPVELPARACRGGERGR